MITVLINGGAGSVRDEESRDRLSHLIHSLLDDAEIVITDETMDVHQLAQDAVERGSRMVVGGGGDGTLSSVAAALIGTDVMMGVLPLGTLNHFARDLGIPPDLEEAIRTLTDGEPMLVDIGEINDQIFLNNSGLGLYPSIVLLREMKQREGVGKWPAAIWAAMKALSRYERLAIRVSVDDQQVLRRTPVVFVGNNEYQLDGVRIPSRDSLDDGMLCVYIPHVQGRFRLIWFTLRALLGRPSDGFDAFLTTECWIETRQRLLRISLDGEVTKVAPPLHYRIRPRALRVMVPRKDQ